MYTEKRFCIFITPAHHQLGCCWLLKWQVWLRVCVRLLGVCARVTAFVCGCAKFAELLRVAVVGPFPRSRLRLISAAVSHCDCHNLWPSLRTPSSPPRMFDFHLVVGKNVQRTALCSACNFKPAPVFFFLSYALQKNSLPPNCLTDDKPLKRHPFPFW